MGLQGSDETSTKLNVEEVRKAIQFVDTSELPLPVMTITSFERHEDFEAYIRGESIDVIKPSIN